MIQGLLMAPAQGAFFYDDQQAIRESTQDGFVYPGTPRTAGFSAIRMPARAMSIGIVLDNGYVAWGDMMSVQYAAAGGREAVFDPQYAEELIKGVLGDRLRGLVLDNLRKDIESLFCPLPTGESIPCSIQYGISQAVLRAYASAQRNTMAEVLTHAYGLTLKPVAVPIYAQSGDQRVVNVQKMIFKRVDILPHGLINSPEKFGCKGEVFKEFAQWVAVQVKHVNDTAYKPILHFDLYGNVGRAFDADPVRIASFIAEVAEAVSPYKLHIEAPADFGSTEAQIDGFLKIKEHLKIIGCDAKIVADEWCDGLDDVRKFAENGAADIIQIKMPDIGSVTKSLEAILLCKAHGIGAYLGGSCVETDLSSRVSVHVAVAGQADMQLAKPGMGVDEALSIVGNEQARLLARLNGKLRSSV